MRSDFPFWDMDGLYDRGNFVFRLKLLAGRFSNYSFDFIFLNLFLLIYLSKIEEEENK